MKQLSHLALWQLTSLARHQNNILCFKLNHLRGNWCGWLADQFKMIGLVWSGEKKPTSSQDRKQSLKVLHTRTHTRIHTRIHIHPYIHTYVCMYTYRYVYLHIYIYTHTYFIGISQWHYDSRRHKSLIYEWLALARSRARTPTVGGAQTDRQAGQHRRKAALSSDTWCCLHCDPLWIPLPSPEGLKAKLGQTCSLTWRLGRGGGRMERQQQQQEKKNSSGEVEKTSTTSTDVSQYAEELQQQLHPQ